MTGEVRRSQLIGTYGVGSIVDTPDHSLMVAGIDRWPTGELEKLYEDRLQRKLHINEFRQPRPVPSRKTDVKSIPCVRFPQYVFCPRCKRLGTYRELTGSLSGTICQACEPEAEDEPLVIPSRFVTVCRLGHIDDFPWTTWIACRCTNPSLRLEMSGESYALSSIKVRCTICDQERTMQDAFRSKEWEGVNCSGKRPWLGDEQPGCGQPITVMQRGATSVHFSVTESAISIPPYSKQAFRIISENWSILGNIPETAIQATLLGFSQGSDVSGQAMIDAYNFKKSEGEIGEEDDLKPKEYQALRDPVDYDECDDFAARAAEVPPEFSDHIQKVVLVDKLRIVTALCGFNRVEPNRKLIANISRGVSSWLPATEVYGEGIFVELAGAKLHSWLAGEGRVVAERLAGVERRRHELALNDNFIREEPVTPELILLHSLSHALIRALTLECGYSSSALQERLYSGPGESGAPMNGILIFTASSDSEGSLGGLVRQGEPTRFGAILADAIDHARWCSSDPLCLESSGQGFNALNLAACHSCSLLPEPACELRNSFLDRATLVGTKDAPEAGYFSDI